MNENSDWWYPTWGTFKSSSGKMDPFTIGVSEVEIDPETTITVDNEGYLRLFYVVKEADVYYFGFADSPLTEMNFK
jgi:hypothetical protein